MAKNDYEGKVKNSGAQSVKAPYPQQGNSSAKTQTGKDLRVKGGK